MNWGSWVESIVAVTVVAWLLLAILELFVVDLSLLPWLMQPFLAAFISLPRLFKE